MKWQVIAAAKPCFRSWDDELVVFNALSGDTHLLDGAAGEILSALSAAPIEIEMLAASLSELWAVETGRRPAPAHRAHPV